MYRSKWFYAFLFCSCLMQALLGNEIYYPHPYKNHPYINCTFGKGRGYEKGFQSIGFIGAITDPRDSQFYFLECQLLYIENRCFGGNAGLGWRTVLNQGRFGIEGFGLNIFLDARDFPDHPLQQLGAGFEYFGHYFNFFINGYFPIGRQTVVRETENFDYGDGFLAQVDACDTAMYGLDFEISSWYLLRNCVAFYVGIGPYYYDTYANPNGPECLLGGMARIGSHLFSIFDCELSFTYDRIFKGCTQFQISASYPLRCLKPQYYFYSANRNPIIVKRPTCRYQTNF